MTHSFGSDIAGIYDCDSRMSITEGLPVLYKDLIGRLADPNLWYDDNYGYPLERLVVNSSAAALAFLAPGIESELQKDKRVKSAKAIIGATADPARYSLTISVATFDDDTFVLIGTLSSIGLSELFPKNT